MPSFLSYDGTRLAYRLVGSGPLLVVIPGGPARDSVYLGNLGGLDAHRTLVVLDNRGTGMSERPSDVDSYRVDRMVEDIEALRLHLGLETVDLLGHSAGAQLLTLYAAAYPARVRSLALITGGQRVAGAAIEGAYMEAIELRAGEPGYADARAALDEWLEAGPSASEELKSRAAMFFYGRPFTDEARAHNEAEASQRHNEAEASQRRNAEAYEHYPHEVDTAAVRKRLAQVTAPVLILAGEVDPAPRPAEAELLAANFPDARVVIQPDAGHFPWLDDPAFFVAAVVSRASMS